MSYKNTITLSNITLLVALSLSAVAAYYSIYGLTAIFTGAVIPVIVMGLVLELGKITTTVWLRKYWHLCKISLKLYLVPAVVLLAVLTSMGIFGFLSKAHMDHGITTGDVQSKLNIIDEKIKTQKDNIDYAKKALEQMDNQVNARLSRGESETSAERAVTIRRQQATERNKLLAEIQQAQSVIQSLNNERAPIAAENRRVEAEVGPIKYVAALIYGDNPDSNALERAVRYVIILLVIVFDPLAIALVLAANSSKEWDEKLNQDNLAQPIILPDNVEPTETTPKEIKKLNEPVDKYKEFISEDEVMNFTEAVAKESFNDIENNEIDFSQHSYLQKDFIHDVPGVEKVGPLVYNPEVHSSLSNEQDDKKIEEVTDEKEIIPVNEEIHITTDNEKIDLTTDSMVIETEGVTKIKQDQDDYVIHDGKQVSKSALMEINPNLFISADNENRINTNFGTKFPEESKIGDIFVRVDILPNLVFKFDGKRWIEISKDNSDSYLHDEEYIKYLIDKLSRGEYDPDLLSENEKEQVENYLQNHI